MILKMSVLIVFMGILSFWQIRHIFKKDGIKEALVYVLLMSLATIVGALLIAGVQLEGQSVIVRLFEPIGKAVLGS